MAESFRTVRKNTIQVAEDIPEEKYSYRAAPDTMSVAEMLAHLATHAALGAAVLTSSRRRPTSRWKTSAAGWASRRPSPRR